ncbi:Vitamin B12 dependent methionine synthase activation subunit [Clostridiaceae bacterium]|nr:Vitamin B12 dependent methionine synthase activation subunit [Clostridiaceae bacterium]RKI18493.1 Vitamin B12 dependent methionine synthase activation subunit [bacterium 1XD21-70]
MEQWFGTGEGFPWEEKEILRYLGHRGQEIPENVKQLIGECQRELENAAAARSVCAEYPLAIQDHVIDMGVLQTKSRNLEKNLRDCGRILIFGATLGSRVDVLLKRYGQLSVSRAVVLQAASAAMLETYCDYCNEAWREEYQKKGWYLRPRFSPGYGDFPLECQKEIFAVLELSKRIGVTLTDSLLMAPSKSVTAVIGLSKKPGTCSVQGCEACGKISCEYRR